MKNLLTLFVGLCLLIVLSCSAHGQVPAEATDFTLTDCDGIEQHLFSKLEDGNVVVIEFEMGCTPCVGGRKALAKIQQQFEATHPGKLQIFTMGFSANMKCATVQSWMSTNNFAGPAFAGDADVISGYNAESGMPTIVVLGGSDHTILYWRGAFSNKDTVAIKAAISQVLSSASVGEDAASKGLKVYPNPSKGHAMLSLTLAEQSNVDVAIFNTVGVKVRSVYKGVLAAGEQQLELLADKLSNGTYYIHVTRNGATDVVPLTVTH